MAEPGAERTFELRTPELAAYQRFDLQVLEGSGPSRVAGALLRAPGALLRDLGQGRRVGAHLASLLGVAVGFCALYGAVLGLHQPGWQTLFAALKIPIVVVGSSLLCTPTLYVFNALGGSRLSGGQTAAVVATMAAAISVILLAFTPVVWFFGVSTEGFGFMTILHLSVFGFAVAFGLRMLRTARGYLRYLDGSEAIGAGILGAWSLLVVVVGLQMAHNFRPILLEGPFHSGQRGLFIEFLFNLRHGTM